MTLLDAPIYNQSRARNRRTLLVSVFLLCGVAGIAVFLCWNVPAEHRVNRFFAAVADQQPIRCTAMGLLFFVTFRQSANFAFFLHGHALYLAVDGTKTDDLIRYQNYSNQTIETDSWPVIGT